MAMHSEDWISIAEQASVETDPAKLMTLVERLCSALDNRKQADNSIGIRGVSLSSFQTKRHTG